jgi:hypothetical protein
MGRRGSSREDWILRTQVAADEREIAERHPDVTRAAEWCGCGAQRVVAVEGDYHGNHRFQCDQCYVGRKVNRQLERLRGKKW